MMFLATVGNEYEKFWDFWWSNVEHRIPLASIPFLVLGCLVGTGIGYSSWWCRSVVSATSFTLIGVINKCLTILLNVAIWDQHATPGGIMSLFVCIVGGLVYQQSPMKGETIKSVAKSQDVVESDESEKVDLIEKGDSSATKRRG